MSRESYKGLWLAISQNVSAQNLYFKKPKPQYSRENTFQFYF